jgi:hypothetical protein
MTLYERILGEKFLELSPLVQKMHCYKGSKTLEGKVNIERGTTLIAKFLNALMQLPKTQEDALLRLELTDKAKEEKWKRTFGTDVFSSIQSQDTQQMVERMGLLKMYFDVYVQDASLCTRLVKTTFLGLTVPQVLTVNIFSEVKEEVGKLLFTVRVNSFSSALVINYEGVIK